MQIIHAFFHMCTQAARHNNVNQEPNSYLWLSMVINITKKCTLKDIFSPLIYRCTACHKQWACLPHWHSFAQCLHLGVLVGVAGIRLLFKFTISFLAATGEQDSTGDIVAKLDPCHPHSCSHQMRLLSHTFLVYFSNLLEMPHRKTQNMVSLSKESLVICDFICLWTKSNHPTLSMTYESPMVE